MLFNLYFKKILKETEYRLLLKLAREVVAKEYLNQITKQNTLKNNIKK